MMLLQELNYDLSKWTPREKVLLQLLISQMRVPLREPGVKGPDNYSSEPYREHSTIRRLLKPKLKHLDLRIPPEVE
jgi:hypothetical protein